MDPKNKPYEIKERLFLFSCDVIRAFPRNSQLDAASLHTWRQLISSATSAGAHLEEAHAGGSRAHFISLTRGGLREMRESNYWLRIISVTKLKGWEGSGPLIQESNELVAILTTIVRNSLLKNAAKATIIVSALLLFLILNS